MKFTHKRAVSPIIASLLLIAIAVAAGIIVYVYVNSLASGLTSGGGQQVSQQLQLQSYTFNVVKTGTTTGSGQVIDIYLENTGSSALSISAIYVDGTALSEWGTTAAGTYGAATELFAVSSTGTSGCYALVQQAASFSVVTTGTAVDGSAASCVATSAPTCGAAGTPLCLSTAATLVETGGVSGTSPLAAQGPNQLIISAAGQTCSGSVVFPSCPATSGTSHTIKIVTANGGVSVFTVVAGKTG